MLAPAGLWRLVIVTLLGFASGLPLALTGQAMQAWLTTAGLDLAAIGFLSLVGVPYTDAQIAASTDELKGKTEIEAVIAYLQGLGLARK